jgi:hypothetical protein
MDLVNPDTLRLVPGQCVQAVYASTVGEPGEVGFFVRSSAGLERQNGDLEIRQRGGVIKFNDVILVVTMIRVEGNEVELFDVWWDYHAQSGSEQFKIMAHQERLTVHFYAAGGRRFSINTENGFRRFFSSLPGLIEKSEPWNAVQFDRAVRGFCAQSYPRENLWEMLELKPEVTEADEAKEKGIDDYAGSIPNELRPFYQYIPGQGHSIRVIPSMFEAKALESNPEDFMYPAPVKTVLRCGIRWVKGFPVAPIPFIPGHGLAVPPDDTEL